MWEYENTHEYIGVSEYVGGERICRGDERTCGRCVRFYCYVKKNGTWFKNTNFLAALRIFIYGGAGGPCPVTH